MLKAKLFQIENESVFSFCYEIVPTQINQWPVLTRAIKIKLFSTTILLRTIILYCDDIFQIIFSLLVTLMLVLLNI